MLSENVFSRCPQYVWVNRDPKEPLSAFRLRSHNDSAHAHQVRWPTNSGNVKLKVRLDHSQPAPIFIKSLPTPEELVEFPSRNYESADNDSKN